MHADAWTRFWSKVAIRDGCWEWTASVNGKGYPNFSASSGKPQLAHRFSYTRFHGPIPQEQQVDHLCDNRRCVRPDHLQLLVCRENVRKAARLRRWPRCPQGRRHEPTAFFVADDGHRYCIGCWERAKAEQDGYRRRTA